MKSTKAFLITVLVFVLSVSQAQVINGTWTGNYAKTLLSFNPRTLIIELSVHNDSLLTGASHLYYGGGKYEHHKITGKYNPRDSTAKFSESMVETNLGMGAYDVLYEVKLVDNGSNWQLSGRWKGTKSPFGFMPFNKVWLEKPKDSIVKKDTIPEAVIPAKENKVIVNKDSIKLNRQVDIQKIIEVSSAEKDSIHIAVYDNGEIDQDSISVYVNDQPVLLHRLITDKPLSFYLTLEKGRQFQKIKMIAENLGTVPPNTALMIITTKKKRYEVRLSSDLDKNAVVEFVLLE